MQDRSLVKLQSEELQVHAQELSKVWRQLDKEKETRVSLNEHLVSIASDLKVLLIFHLIVDASRYVNHLFTDRTPRK